MERPVQYQLKRVNECRFLRVALFLVIFLCSVSNARTQPNWVATTPSVDPTAVFVDVNYGIDEAGTVYGCLINFSYDPGWDSNDVKDYSQQAVNSDRISNIDQDVNGADINQLLTLSVYNQFSSTYLVPNHTYTLFLVAEDDDAGILTGVTRIEFTTPPCPTPINLLTGPTFIQPCVNLGAAGTFDFATTVGSSNILKGSTWTIDWGDGSPDWTDTSPDNDVVPGGVFFGGKWFGSVPHTYTIHDSCWSLISVSIVNPGACTSIGAYGNPFYPGLHGRDINLDGNGDLLVVEDVTNIPDTIRVCAGNEHKVVLRDLSTWDCDFPVYLPTDIPQIPANASGEVNNSIRTIQFMYGLDPAGNFGGQNTIDGIVKIGASGTAESGVSGHYSDTSWIQPPDPVVNPTTISDTIVIPASCGAGEIFKVYLKNWNKCNQFPGGGTAASNSNYISDEIVILVIASPPAPTTPDVVVCAGDDETLTVTSPPVGQFNWYYDGLKANPIPFTGAAYDPSLGVAGIDTFYVADEQLTGNLCEGAPDTVVLTINPIPAIPTISVTSSSTPKCFDGATVELTATGDINTDSWKWYEDGPPPMGGETGNTITVGPAALDHDYTVKAIGIATTLCESAFSTPQNVTITLLATVNAGGGVAAICQSGTTAALGGSFGGGATAAEWDDGGAGGSFANNDGGTPGTATYTAAAGAPASVTLTLTTSGGGCGIENDFKLLTVNPNPTVSIGPAIADICLGVNTGVLGG
jgi:hypothetical protein